MDGPFEKNGAIKGQNGDMEIYINFKRNNEKEFCKTCNNPAQQI